MSELDNIWNEAVDINQFKEQTKNLMHEIYAEALKGITPEQQRSLYMGMVEKL